MPILTLAFSSLISLSSQNLIINIDDDRYLESANEFSNWFEIASKTPEAEAVKNQLNQNFKKAILNVEANQQKILAPLTRDLDDYLKYLQPDPNKCDTKGFIDCELA